MMDILFKKIFTKKKRAHSGRLLTNMHTVIMCSFAGI